MRIHLASTRVRRIRSPEWKFLYTLCIRIYTLCIRIYTLCIRIRVDARIRIFLYTLTSHYQNLLTAPLRCPDTNRIRVDGRIRFAYAKCGHRYFSIRIKKFADTIISRYVSTGPKRMRQLILSWLLLRFHGFVFGYCLGLDWRGWRLLFDKNGVSLS